MTSSKLFLRPKENISFGVVLAASHATIGLMLFLALILILVLAMRYPASTMVFLGLMVFMLFA